MTVKIITDSTASIPKELCDALDITVVPAIVHFGSYTFVDGVDPAEEFYARLMAGDPQPTTSTPSPGDFVKVYQEVAARASAIVSIHLMETKSTLINTARMAAAMLPGVPVQVVDSGSTTLGLGMLTLAAARAAQAGQAVAEVVHAVERLVPRVNVHAAIPQLTQLRRSGRVSLSQAMLGGLLSIKPVLHIGQSAIDVVDRVRGWAPAVDRMVEMALARAGDARVRLAVVHTNAEAEARELLDRVRHRFNAVEVMVTEAGTALATHAGPGALGIVTIPEQ